MLTKEEATKQLQRIGYQIRVFRTVSGALAAAALAAKRGDPKRRDATNKVKLILGLVDELVAASTFYISFLGNVSQKTLDKYKTS